jgi:hypothetical protein
VKGRRPGHLPPPSQPQDEGRVCIEPGCETRLSVYNEGLRCWQHSGIRFPNYRGRRLIPQKD